MIDILKKQNILVVTIGALVVSLSVWLFGFFSEPTTLELNSLVQAKEIKASSRFGGRVETVMVQEGVEVKKGDSLLQFDESDIDARLDEAKATLSQAKSQLSLLEKGANSAEIQQVKAKLELAKQQYKLATQGARPEQLKQATSKIESAQSQLTLAEQQLDNAKTMLEEGIISKQKYEQLSLQVKQAQGDMDAAQAGLSLIQEGSPDQIQTAKSQLDAANATYRKILHGADRDEVSIALRNVEKAQAAYDTLVKQQSEVALVSPINGVVSTIAVSEGELVQPGRPVMTLIEYSTLWANVYVPESKLRFVTPGKTVSIRSKAYKNVNFEGRVAVINPKSEFVPSSGGNNASEESTFRVKVAISPQDKTKENALFPGMEVKIRFD